MFSIAGAPRSSPRLNTSVEKSMYDLAGKAVLLTGGATGIGRRIATRLAEEGCDIGIADINPEEAERTAAKVMVGIAEIDAILLIR